MSENFELGQVEIADDVIINLAGIATSTVKGASVARPGMAKGITNMFSKNNYSGGIKIEKNEDIVAVDINIDVVYGSNIKDIANEVQTAVKKEIEAMTSLNVSIVNVHVLNFIQEKGKDLTDTLQITE